MAVTASLVLGADGSSTLHGNSNAISTPEDRQRFLVQRRLHDAILIGGKTARSEGYRRTPVPLVVLSRTQPQVLDENPLAHWWAISPTEAVARARWEFGSSLAIEGGVSFITELLEAHLISQLDLSITSHVGGENRIDPNQLMSYFEKIDRLEEGQTIFYRCTFAFMTPR